MGKKKRKEITKPAVCSDYTIPFLQGEWLAICKDLNNLPVWFKNSMMPFKVDWQFEQDLLSFQTLQKIIPNIVLNVAIIPGVNFILLNPFFVNCQLDEQMI